MIFPQMSVCRSEIPKMVNAAMIQSSVVRLEMILQCPYYPQNEFELKWFGRLMSRSGSCCLSFQGFKVFSSL